MRAAINKRYGSAGGVIIGEFDKPAVPIDGVLVRVSAASLNPVDWYGLTGTPYFSRPMQGVFKPKDPLLGADFAGTVEEVGPDETELRPGDEVFGTRSMGGSIAEYVPGTKGVAHKPANVTFEEAAAVPVAGITALQALRDHGKLQAGQSVLINGASGGVGTFAVQIAKALGADATGVCSSRNVDLVRSLGADTVIDYTREDFTRSGRRYDLLLDVAGSRSWQACRRALASQGTAVVVGGPKNQWVGPMAHIAGMLLASRVGGRRAVFMIANVNRADLGVLRDLIEAGKVKPVIDRRYALGDVASAIRYLGEGHARGKVVITV